MGDGTTRYYTSFHNQFPDLFYRLVLEILPNGNQRHFSYVENKSFLLKRVWTTDPSNSLTLNWLNFSFKNKNLDIYIDASNGQSVHYHLKIEKGTTSSGRLLHYTSQQMYQWLLEKVTGKHLPTFEYEVISRSHFISTLFSRKKLTRPNGRFLKVDYDDRERVKKLWMSGLDLPLYTFHYHSDHTEVIDANGGVKRFYYNNRRLTKLVEPHRTQRYCWDDKGQLLHQDLLDSNNNLITQHSYSYDDRGNICESKIMGVIGNNQKNEHFIELDVSRSRIKKSFFRIKC